MWGDKLPVELGTCCVLSFDEIMAAGELSEELQSGVALYHHL